MRYESLDATNTAVEALVERLGETGTTGVLWKLIRYFDPSHPEFQATDEWSLFRLEDDPAELKDVFEDARYTDIVAVLRRRLGEERSTRLVLGAGRPNDAFKSI